MARPKYTDPGVNNQTRDDATDHIDSLFAGPIRTGKKNASEKGKTNNNNNEEDIKNDCTSESDEIIEDSTDYSFDGDEEELDDNKFYGKSL